MTLHVLTACSRPWNLQRMATSLNQWGPADVQWHLRFDPTRKHVGGQALKNQMLDEIVKGWVMFLDDDTIAHPKLWKRLRHYLDGSTYDAVIVSQRRSDRSNLQAAAENVQVGEIDIGQAVLRRSLIAGERIPESYAGDGEFLSAVLPKGNVRYLDELLSYYNALAP